MPRIHRIWGSLGLTTDLRMTAVISRVVPDSICALDTRWKQAWRERRLKAGSPVREASMRPVREASFAKPPLTLIFRKGSPDCDLS